MKEVGFCTALREPQGPAFDRLRCGCQGSGDRNDLGMTELFALLDTERIFLFGAGADDTEAVVAVTAVWGVVCTVVNSTDG